MPHAAPTGAFPLDKNALYCLFLESMGFRGLNIWVSYFRWQSYGIFQRNKIFREKKDGWGHAFVRRRRIELPKLQLMADSSLAIVLVTRLPNFSATLHNSIPTPYTTV